MHPEAGPFRTKSKSLPIENVGLNNEILQLTDEAFMNLRMCSRLQRPSRTAEGVTDELVQTCYVFLDSCEQRMNYVNISTLVHRIGRFANISGMQKHICERHPVFLRRIIALIHLHLEKFSTRNLANVVWGLGKLGSGLKKVPMPNMAFDILMADIGRYARKRSRTQTFSHRHLSNFLYGLACLECTDQSLVVGELAFISLEVMDDFLNQELANFVWALAKLGYVDQYDVLQQAVQSAMKRTNSMNPQEISNFLWGLAVMNHFDCKELLEMLLVRHTQSLWTKEMMPQTLSNFVWSAHALAYRVDLEPANRLLDSMFSEDTMADDQECLHLFNFEPKHIVTVLYAYSLFCHKSPNVEKLAQAAKIYFRARRARFSNKDIALLAWSLMMMGELDEKFMSMVLHHVRYLKPTNPLGPMEVRQLYQCLLHYQVLCPEVVLTEGVPIRIKNLWKKSWVERQKTSPVPKWVVEALVHMRQMGCVCEERYMAGQLINTCLVELEGEGHKFALEGLSYSRRYWNEEHAAKVSYVWKLKILRGLGYSVIVLDEHFWILLTSEKAIKKYLQDRIHAAMESSS